MTETKIKLSKAQLAQWQEEVARSQRRIESLIDNWKKLVKSFTGKQYDPASDPNIVPVNKDWPRVKQKISQLCFRVPELIAKPRHPQWGPAAPLVAAAINDVLNRRMEVSYVMEEVLTDTLAAAGLGVCKVGYEVVKKQIDLPVLPGVGPAPSQPVLPAAPVQAPPADPMADPMAAPMAAPDAPQPGEPVLDQAQQMPPELLAGMAATGLVETVPQDVPLYERFYCLRISPADFLSPSSFRGSNWDEASWLGYRFEMPLSIAKRQFKLPKDFEPSRSKPSKTLADGLPWTPNDSDSAEDMVHGTEIWYYARYYDESIVHPEHIRRLVLIDGLHDRPALHEDSKYQRWDEALGKFIGQRKLPIRPLTLTYVPDSSMTPSDAEVSQPQVRELTWSRTLAMMQRKRSLPIRWFDVNQLAEEAEDIIRNGDIQSWIPMNGPGERAIGEIARANYPRESIEFDRMIESDLNEAWSLGPNQIGADTVGRTTAREVQTMDNAVAARLDFERNKVLRWFTELAKLVLDLVQLYHDDTDWVEVIGQDGLKRLQAWDRTKIDGEYAFEVRVDSSIRLDAMQERESSLKLYQLTANDPFVNRQKIVERLLLAHNLDPGLVMAQPQPQKPESPNVSFRFGGDDVSPLNPAFPIVMSIMALGGYQIDPKVVQAAYAAAQRQLMMGDPGAPQGPAEGPPQDTQHGGPVEQVQPLSKHQLDSNGV